MHINLTPFKSLNQIFMKTHKKFHLFSQIKQLMTFEDQAVEGKAFLKKYSDDIFQKRLSERYKEFYRLYNSVYHNDEKFSSLLDLIYEFYKKRSETLKNLDKERIKDPKWHCQNDSIGIQIYADKFAGNLRNIETKLDYLQKIGVKFVYALPFLDSPPEKSDGGFAVANYRKVRPDLGTNEDLEHLINTLHQRNMCFCMDFIINHTSDEHEWAQRAKKGEIEYQNRYYFYDSWYIPNQFDSYGVMGHFFGDIAPDNFTYVPECQKIVMTTFYPYQWDLNFTNPVVFEETLSNILYLMNLGVDVVFFNGTSNMWKKPGTSCRNLNRAYILNEMIFIAMQIVCPGCAAWFDLKRHKRDQKEDSDEEENENENIELDKWSDNDESESENEKEFIITESGVITADAYSDLTKRRPDHRTSSHENLNEEEEESIDFDQSKEIGSIHQNFGWMSRLWASLAMCDVRSISYSINAICNRFKGDAYFTRVHSHDDINWGNGFDVELNSLIGNGLGNSDGYKGGIISLYRYLNDFFTGKMPGSFSKGITFAEDLVTGKARICGTTASLLGLERALKYCEKAVSLKKSSNEQNRKIIEGKLKVQSAIDRILLLHAVSASMPSMFLIYFGDEIGKLNDYNYKNYPDISHDTRFIQRGFFNWDSTEFIEKDENSYQSRIFNGIKSITSARFNYPSFTENKRTVFLKSYTRNQYYDEEDIHYAEKNDFEVDAGILIYKRFLNNGKFLLFIFNFNKYQRSINILKSDISGKFRDLISGKVIDQINDFRIKEYGYLWLEPID